MLVAQEDVVLGQVLEPGLFGLLVHLGAVFRGAFEHGGIKEVLVYSVHIREKLPSPVDSLGLEVIAKAPVAKHLEHGVVVGVVPNLFQVVMFSADSQALLCVYGAVECSCLVAEEDVLELVHSGVGKHEGGVVLYDHGGRGHHRVPL